MRHVRMLGLCLVAVFALAAVAAAGSASAAEPEWGHCIAKKKAVYADSNCTTVATKHGVPDHKGAYEWIPGNASCYPMKKGTYTESGCVTVATKHGVPDHKGSYEKTGGGAFTSKGGAGDLTGSFQVCENDERGEGAYTEPFPCEHGPSGGWISSSVECESENGSGEAFGVNGVKNVQVAFHDCVVLGSLTCTSPGASEGEIKPEPLKGELGYYENEETHAKHQVGVVLKPATGTKFAKFTCGTGESELEFTVGQATTPSEGYWYKPSGSNGIISPLAPVNTMTEKFTQHYATEETEENGEPGYVNVENVPRRFEGGPLENLEAKYSVGPIREAKEEEGQFHASDWSSAGESIENTNTTTEGPAEIKG